MRAVFFEHSQNIVCLELDHANFKVLNRLVITNNFLSGKTKNQYLTDFTQLDTWLAQFGSPVTYIGPRIGGVGPALPFQPQPMNPLPDSEAFLEIIGNHKNLGVPIRHRMPPSVSSSEKGVVEACYFVQNAVDVYLILASLKTNATTYSDIAAQLKQSDQYLAVERLITMFLPSSQRRRIGYSARERAIQAFSAPSKKYLAVKQALGGGEAVVFGQIAAQPAV